MLIVFHLISYIFLGQVSLAKEVLILMIFLRLKGKEHVTG